MATGFQLGLGTGLTTYWTHIPGAHERVIDLEVPKSSDLGEHFGRYRVQNDVPPASLTEDLPSLEGEESFQQASSNLLHGITSGAIL